MSKEYQKAWWAKMTLEEAKAKRKEYNDRAKAKRLLDVQENAKKIEVTEGTQGFVGA